MMGQLILLFIAIGLSFTLYPIWINFVYKYQMGETIRTDGPQTHLKKSGTPSMGGLVFIVVVAIITLLFNQSRTQTIFPLFVASMAGLFGILEDFFKVYEKSKLSEIITPQEEEKRRLPKFLTWPFDKFKEFSRIIGSSSGRGIQTYQKLLIQAAIGGFVAYWTYFKLGWDFIWFPLIGNVEIGWMYPIFIFFMFIAVLNFVAFTDGLDGLAGGLGIIAIGAYWVIASQLGFNSLAGFCAAFIGALLPFLYFNIHPARIFMGDVGSHVLGATLAILAVVMHREIALLFICAVFLIDGISSPIQQFSVKLTGKRIFRMAPLHHHFELKGWPESKVTERFWLFGIFFAFIGIAVALL